MSDRLTLDLIAIPPSRMIGGYAVQNVVQKSGSTVLLDVLGADGKRRMMQVPAAEECDNPTLARRFERAVEIFKTLGPDAHPPYVEHGTYAADYAPAIPFIVTDAPIGKSLADWMAERKSHNLPPDVQFGIRVLFRLGRFLARLHRQAIVHRNLKPNIVRVTRDVDIEVLDYVLSLGVTSGVTRRGSYLGTARYIAPEQVKGASDVDGRADLYALGLIIYEFVTHHHPFGAPSGTKVEEVMKHLQQEPDPPSWVNMEVMPDLDRIIGRLIKIDPAERYKDGDELADHVHFCFPNLTDDLK